jgi:anti-sigma B factor antagonist
MELTVDTLEGGIRCIRLKGRLDLKGTQSVDPQFTAQVGALKQSVVVDMSGVEYIASIGIRMLLSNVKTITPAGATMVIYKPQKMVEDVLRMAGMDAVIPIEHDLEAALVLVKAP